MGSELWAGCSPSQSHGCGWASPERLGNDQGGSEVTDNQSDIFGEAFYRARAARVQGQLTQFYQRRSADDIREEADWAAATQDDALAQWDAEAQP